MFSVDYASFGLSPGDNVHAKLHDDGEGNVSLLFLRSETESRSIPTGSNDQPHLASSPAASALIGCAIGTLLAGPIIWIVVAGVVYGVQKYPNKFEETANKVKKSSIGLKAVALSTLAFQKAKRVDERLKVSATVKATADSLTVKAKEIDTKYMLSDRAAAATQTVSGKIQEIDSRYKVLESVQSASAAVGDKVIATTKGVDEKYHLSEKLNAVGSAVSTKAQELDSKFKVSETLSAALYTGKPEGERRDSMDEAGQL